MITLDTADLQNALIHSVCLLSCKKVLILFRKVITLVTTFRSPKCSHPLSLVLVVQKLITFALKNKNFWSEKYSIMSKKSSLWTPLFDPPKCSHPLSFALDVQKISIFCSEKIIILDQKSVHFWAKKFTLLAKKDWFFGPKVVPRRFSLFQN